MRRRQLSTGKNSVVQRAVIEWGGMIAHHARGRLALNLDKRVNLCKFQQLPRVTGTRLSGKHHNKHHSSHHSKHHSSHQEDDR